MVRWSPPVRPRAAFNYWRYESIDLAPWLVEGDNVLAVEVFNLGEERPAAMFSRQTAFIFQSDKSLDGRCRFKYSRYLEGCWRTEAFSPISVSGDDVGGYYVAGPTDRFQSELHTNPGDGRRAGL